MYVEVYRNDKLCWKYRTIGRKCQSNDSCQICKNTLKEFRIVKRFQRVSKCVKQMSKQCHQRVIEDQTSKTYWRIRVHLKYIKHQRISYDIRNCQSYVKHNLIFFCFKKLAEIRNRHQHYLLMCLLSRQNIKEFKKMLKIYLRIRSRKCRWKWIEEGGKCNWFWKMTLLS